MADFTLKLTLPVVSDGQTITQITLKSPNVTNFKKLLKVVEIEDPIEEAEETISILSGLDRAAIGDLAFEDFAILAEAVAPLLDGAFTAATKIFEAERVH